MSRRILTKPEKVLGIEEDVTHKFVLQSLCTVIEVQEKRYADLHQEKGIKEPEKLQFKSGIEGLIKQAGTAREKFQHKIPPEK